VQVHPQPVRSGAVAAGGEVRTEPEGLTGDRLGQPADHPPARREAGVGHGTGEVGDAAPGQ
jgi:hypothetical protein